MSRKARPIEGDVCWFCKQPEDTASWMELGFLKSTYQPVYEGNYILYHEPCAVYSNGAGVLPPEGMDDESVLRFWLHGERCSGIGLRCQLCGLKGATTGCLHGPCQQFYHYPCARVRAFQGHLQFSLQCRSLACSDHLHMLPMPVEEQHLGMWMEGGGSWNGTQLEAATAWLQNYNDNMRNFKKRWSHLLTMTPYEELKAKEAKAQKKGKRRSDDNDPDFRAKKSGRSSNPGSRSRASQQQVPASPAAAGRASDSGIAGSSTPSRQQRAKQKWQQRPSAVGVPAEIAAQTAQEGTATARSGGLAEVVAFGAIADALRPSEDGSGMQQQQQHWWQQQQQQWPDLEAEEQLRDSPADADWQQQQQPGQQYGMLQQQQLGQQYGMLQQQPLDCDLLLQAAGFTTPRTSNQQLLDASGHSGPQTQPASGGAAAAAAAAGPSSAAAGTKGAGGGSRTTESINVKADASCADSAPDGQQGRPAAAAGGLADAAAQFAAAAGLRNKQQHDNNQQQQADQAVLHPAAAAAGVVSPRLTAPLLHRLNSHAVATLSAAAENSECGGVSFSGGVFHGPRGTTLDSNAQQSRRRKFLDVNEFLRSGRKLLSYDLGTASAVAGDVAAAAAAGNGDMAAAAAAAGGHLGSSHAQQQQLQRQMKVQNQQIPTTQWLGPGALSAAQQSSSAAVTAAAATAAAVLKSVSSGGGGLAGAAGTSGNAAAAALPVGWRSQRGTDMLTWLKQTVQQHQQQQPDRRQQQQQQCRTFDASAVDAPADSSQALQALQAALTLLQKAGAGANASAGTAAAAALPAEAASAERSTALGSVATAQKAGMEAAAVMAKIATDPDMDDAQRGQLLQNALKAARAYLQPRSSTEDQGLQRTADVSSSCRNQQQQQVGSSPLQSPRLQQQQQQQQLNGSAAAAAPTSSLLGGMQAVASPGSALAAAIAGLADLGHSGGFLSSGALSTPMDQPADKTQQPQVGSRSNTQNAEAAALLAKLTGLMQRTSSNQITAAPAQAAASPAQQQQLAARPAAALTVHRPLMREYFGCVTSLPALQAGEMRVAGVTAHPSVVAAYAKHDTRRALQLQPWSIVLPPAALRQLAAWGVPAHKLANDLYGLLHASNVLNNHLTNTSDGMPNGMGSKAAVAAVAAVAGRQQSGVQLSGGYAGMPQDLPARYVRGVMMGTDDRRRGLQGQFGLTATQDLSAGTILGPWRSYVLTSSDYASLMGHVPADWQDPGGVNRQQAWLDLLHKFTLALRVPCLEGSDPFGSTTSSGQMLYFCALGYGNLTCLANDPIVDPWAAAQSPVAECELVAQPNVDIVAVLVNGMPLPLMVTTKEVRNGEQLCYSYGRQYWQTWCELKRALQQQQQQGGTGRMAGKLQQG